MKLGVPFMVVLFLLSRRRASTPVIPSSGSPLRDLASTGPVRANVPVPPAGSQAGNSPSPLASLAAGQEPPREVPSHARRSSDPGPAISDEDARHAASELSDHIKALAPGAHLQQADVRAFQRRMGHVTADGIVGPQTIQRMQQLLPLVVDAHDISSGQTVSVKVQ